MHRTNHRRKLAVMLMLIMATLGAGALSPGPAHACYPVANCVPTPPRLQDKAIKIKINVGHVLDINRITHTSTITLTGTAVRTTNVDGVERLVVSKTVPNTLQNTGVGQQAAQTAGGTPPPCYSSSYGDGFKAYSSSYAWSDATFGYVQYRYAPFTQDNARYLADVGSTWQVEICQVGGGQSAGGWRMNNVGTYMTLQDTNPRVLAAATYNGQTVSPDRRALNFQISWKAVTISSSIDVGRNHRQAGAQGKTQYAAPYNQYPQNGVYQYWDGTDSWENSYQGSDEPEGNVSHGLWEYPMSHAYASYQGTVWLSVNCPGNHGCD